MEIIKSLPDVFEEFGEARRNAFLSVKNIKEQGIPVIGAYCTYFPQEIVTAGGATSVSLCSMSDEPIPDAEQDLPANLCPLVKSSYGFAKTDKCPFFHFSDIVVGETTCDGKKKMYELMSEFKEMYLMKLPNSQDEFAKELWRKEVRKFKDYMEEKLGVEITDEKLRDAVRAQNELREAQRRLSDVMKNDPAPIHGLDLFGTIEGSGYKFDKKAVAADVNALAERIEEDYMAGKNIGKKPRILVTGCPMGGGSTKVIKAIEDNGGVAVAFENCSGYKSFNELVDPDADDILDAIADRYLNIGCSVMTPNPNRLALLEKLMDEFHVDGVIEMTLSACLTYNIESKTIERFVTSKGKPYLGVETDYSQADVAQLNTRVTAFLEML
jgi:benzoyl-CoA reductase/2-hydroxyglutaryl-CoA dehydratase subunit BcrC/BadD/HgdB